MSIALITTLAWLAYALLFPGWPTRVTAKRWSHWWCYPRESARGNYPPAQRVHEGGGFRLNSIIAAPVVFGLCWGLIAVGLVWPLSALLAVLAGPFATFKLLRLWIDIAEHEAEILYVEKHRPEGWEEYREAEAARMRETRDYHLFAKTTIRRKLINARWRARIVLLLGSW